MNMNEEQLMAIVGRLYVGTILRDNELRRLNGLVGEYERAARSRSDDGDDEKADAAEES